MRELVFQVEFLSDIVLPATSNTEGNIQQLEFIPGSNFLGMVASKTYNDFSDSIQIFHSGDVRFGDASLVVDGEVYYKMPFSFFHPKLDNQKIYNHHFLDDKQKKELGQLKQMRNGYISGNLDNGLKVKYIDYTYSQKSAYDGEKRRSKNSSMYGYKAIMAGTKWQFKVKCSDTVSDDDIKKIKENLEGKRYLGKSKSSQYGKVEITYIEEKNTTIQKTDSSEIILYANSRLALVDDAGNPIYELKYLISGLDDENIIYSKCQIKTSFFTPYNSKMQTKCYERLVIEKGSVIVLKDLTDEQIEKLQSGVGAYLSEGFGELIVNPPFLLKKGKIDLAIDEENKSKKDLRKKIDKTFKDTTVQFLVNKHNESIEKLELANEVAKFIKDNVKKYPKKMNSQWGSIRSLCITSDDKNIKEKVEKYISNGVAKEKWQGDKKSTLLTAIENSSTPLKFTKLLSIEMPKQKEGAKS